MPIFLCYDSIMRQTPWSAEKYNGMINEFAKRRIKYFPVYSPEELREYLKKYENEESSIVFFPINDDERKFFFDRYKEFNIHKIIFSHHDVNTATSNFSSILSDFYGDMELAISHLKERGCEKIALFNANPTGYHDRLRIETYKQFIYHEPIIFLSDKTIHPVLQRLVSHGEKIDAIICTNDFAAFCLMLALNKIDKDWNKKILLLSFSNTAISSLCYPSLSSISLNYTSGGKEIATIHNLIKKNPHMAYMHIVIKNCLAARETTENFNPSGIVFSELPRIGDDELIEITSPRTKCMSLEKLLAVCDDIDLKIMHGLILSRTIDEISKSLYLSYQTVKYRIKKFKAALDFSTTAELSAWLKLWISPDNLEKKIMQLNENEI